jgi:flotillin
MTKKAVAWGEYNEAAIVQMFVERMPELAKAIAEPLSKTERIVLISQDGHSAGASKVTRDVTEIMAQLPAVMEALTGVKLQDVLKKIPALSDLQVDPDKVQAGDNGKKEGIEAQ